MNRRAFLAASAAPLAAAGEPKRLAAIITEYRPGSHADVVIGKYLELRSGKSEKFIDTMTRVGQAPFKEALYASA